ncbi:hypothetical protein BaRGS_00038486 [Batillaria attramentaria]|uniref:Secreted protein n=1 Tax=Batillaria attramentaria TaxID=370345 RepID=A0ABD0J5Z5_9CAEN
MWLSDLDLAGCERLLFGLLPGLMSVCTCTEVKCLPNQCKDLTVEVTWSVTDRVVPVVGPRQFLNMDKTKLRYVEVETNSILVNVIITPFRFAARSIQYPTRTAQYSANLAPDVVRHTDNTIATWVCGLDRNLT